MKKFNIILFLSVLAFSCFSQSPPPVNKKIKMNYKLNELLVNDSSFMSMIDSLVLRPECKSVNQNKDGFFYINFDKDKCRKASYLIVIEFSYPSVSYSPHYFFKFKDYIFMLYGEYPPEIFTKTEKSRTFIIEGYTIPNIESFPIWHIAYSNKEFTLEVFDCW